ncbi:MAG: hypothetical protein U1A27_13830 [Phycisphaerae bacterium]
MNASLKNNRVGRALAGRSATAAAALVLALACQQSRGQVIWDEAYELAVQNDRDRDEPNTFYSGPRTVSDLGEGYQAGCVYDNPEGFSHSGGLSLSVNNWTTVLDHSMNDAVVMYAVRPFRVGDIPIVWQTRMCSSGKIVNGGGDYANPLTSWTIQAWVEGDVDGNPLLTASRTPPVNGFMQGMGYQYIDSVQNSLPVVLGAHQEYYLKIAAVVPISMLAFRSQVPPVAVTGEFGAPGFLGLRAIGFFQTVPEPATLTLMLPGVLALLRRRHG